jgi:hypothetical protein
MDNQGGPDPVVVAQKQVAAFEDGRMRQQGRAARDDPDRVAAGMAVDADETVPHQIARLRSSSPRVSRATRPPADQACQNDHGQGQQDALIQANQQRGRGGGKLDLPQDR